MARNKNGCSKVSSSLTSASKMPLAKAFNVAVMSSYHQYCSLPKEICNLISFTEFMVLPEADDNWISTSSFQQQKEKEILNNNKEAIGHKLEEITIRGQTIRDVGNVTPRCEAYSEICNSSDTTSLPQDVASFGQEENNDLYSIFEGTYGASMRHDDGNGTSHHKQIGRAHV